MQQHKIIETRQRIFFENQRFAWDFDSIVLLTLGYNMEHSDFFRNAQTEKKSCPALRDVTQTFPSAWVLFLVGVWRIAARVSRKNIVKREDLGQTNFDNNYKKILLFL